MAMWSQSVLKQVVPIQQVYLSEHATESTEELCTHGYVVTLHAQAGCVKPTGLSL